MNGALKFFLNAIKAILFSPFYVLTFIFSVIVSFFIHMIGEVKVLFTGFKYGSKNENKYYKELKRRNPQGGNGL